MKGVLKLMSNVTRDENSQRTSINAIIEVKSAGFIPDTYDQSVTVTDATEIFAIASKPYDNGMNDYAAIAAGEYGNPDLDGMMEWLSENNPDLFNDLLLAVLNHADEDDLDDALDLAGWNDDADIVIGIDADWLREELGEATAAEFLHDLRDSLQAYLEENGYEEFTFSIDPYEWEECDDCDCDEPEEDEDDCDDCAPYEIAIDGGLDEADAACLECGIDLNVIRPLLAKYGLDNDDYCDCCCEDDPPAADPPPAE